MTTDSPRLSMIKQNGTSVDRHSDLPEVCLCPECDLVIRVVASSVDNSSKQRLCCPRCRCVLIDFHPNGLTRALALTLSGILLFFPANLLPVLSMEILGSVQSATLWDGVMVLYREGLGVVAAVVFFTAILIPLLRLLILLQVLLAAFQQTSRQKSLWLARRLLRNYVRFTEWGMVEIYLLAVLVAVIKLADMATVHPGIGLFCFAGLMLAELGVSLNLDEGALWEKLGEGRS